MAGDKYSAVWVSHSSISDFVACPRAYFLKNIFRDKKSNHKIKVMSAPLALGSAVHEVIEGLSVLATNQRLKDSLVIKFQDVWKKFSGKRGGFFAESVEQAYKRRGEEMLLRVMKNPGPLVFPAVKIREDLPHYFISEEKNIILCGKIDWLEYIAETDSVHIIDFKTSKQEESEESLQLPIYHLLVHNTQKRPVSKASYWYIAFKDTLTPKPLPDLQAAHEKVMEVAVQMKTARQLGIFKCHEGENGCRNCKPYEAVVRGDAEFIGNDAYNADIYIIPQAGDGQLDEDESYIL